MPHVKATLALLALVFTSVSVAAQGPSPEAIVCALNPQCAKRPLTRSLSRGLSVSGGQAEQKLSIDIYVNFAYDSAELQTDARITLDRLGIALSDPRLRAYNFMIAGHTDAKGGDPYNRRLSERRAQTVRQYLIGRFGIDARHLSAVGYGKSRLLDPARPEDGVNRRVQVINTTAQ
jgi:outer membrane protein OmpA-like peptidoglycan-associated protein